MRENVPSPLTSAKEHRAQDFLELVERARRGRLKIYLGFAAGVGKSYRMLEEAHALRLRGVDVVLGASVVAFETRDGAVSGVRLADGRVFECDVAIVGIGALANDALAAQAGLACRDGVVVDENARTSDPAIFAIGDCTQRPVPRYARSVRLESVPNALEQGKQAAAAICGKPAPKAEVPWFWSDQYDVRLQIAGLPVDVRSTVVRGDPQAGRFAVFHLDGEGRLQAVEAVNAAPEFVAARQWVAAGQVLDAGRIADASLTVKQIVDSASPAAPAPR